MLGGGIGIPTVGLLTAAMIAQSVSLYSGFFLAISLAPLAVPLVITPIRLVEFDNG